MLTAANLPQVLVNCGNGFMVAECDLELRGAGEVLGKRQSGRDIKTTFKVRCRPAGPLLVLVLMLIPGSLLILLPPLCSSRPHPQVARIPGDRLLLDQAREAASQLLAEQPDPRHWSPELRALVADAGLLQLDTISMPTLDA